MSTQDNFIYTKMQKFDKRRSLNWWERIVEKARLIREIKDLEQKIRIKEKKTRGNILEYKRSGIPVLQLNVYYKRMELDKLNGVEVQKTRKHRKDLGIKRGKRANGIKATKQLEEDFLKLNSN